MRMAIIRQNMGAELGLRGAPLVVWLRSRPDFRSDTESRYTRYRSMSKVWLSATKILRQRQRRGIVSCGTTHMHSVRILIKFRNRWIRPY
jgi:hypothetical protein